MSIPDLVRRVRLRDRPPIPHARPPGFARHPNEGALNALAHAQIAAAVYFVARSNATGRLIDIGCGQKPYEKMLSAFVSEHVGVDHSESPHALTHVDVLATAYDIPLQSESFDTALLGEVLEHLEEPKDALNEAWRLLRPSGKVILTTPFIWSRHEEPRDFYRYGPFGLRYLLGSAGFRDIVVTPVGGQWATVAILFSYALRPYRRGFLRHIIDAVALCVQSLAVRLDRVHFKSETSYNHVAVATKPAREPKSLRD